MKTTALILSAAVFASACSTPQTTSASSPPVTAAASPTSAVAPAPATASPTGRAGFATHENPILGYRISLPDAYRRLTSVVLTGGGENLGSELFTRRTELEERELCLRHQGGVPPPEWETDVVILIYRNIGNVPAAQWANTPRVPDGQALSTHRTVEPFTVDGRQAVRLVWEQTKGGETAGYLISANERMYVLMPPVSSLPSQLPKGWLDDIATSFRAIAPQPPPAPTGSPSPTPRCGN